MKLSELKKSLAKLPPDMGDMEVTVMYLKDGKQQCECLCFMGYLPVPNRECIVLGTRSTIINMVENGEIEPPDGYNECDTGN